MNASTAQEMREDYLRRLDTAISDIPHRLAVELRAGIAEELSSTNSAILEARIDELGTPEEVAQAAIEAGFGGPSPSPATAPAPASVAPLATTPATVPLPLAETRGYAITSAILLGIGGIVIPFVGWVAGAILVANSKLWSTGEKLWAISFPLLAMIASVLVWLAVGIVTSQTPAGPQSSDGLGAPSEAGLNPLVPAFFDVIWSSILVAIVVAPFTAAWLVLRLRSRKLSEN